jgi:serine phosphatase RsbU (regulator of sigma subunit)
MSAEQHAANVDMQYLGVELRDPPHSTSRALKYAIVIGLLILFAFDLRDAADFNVTYFYVVLILAALRLQSVRWVLGVTVASVVLNLFAARWSYIYRPDFTMRLALGHVEWAAFAQVPAGLLSYQTIAWQRKLDRANKRALRRLRAMYERERAARTAEQDARRRELAAAAELRAHAAELSRTIESEREARRREREALTERDHLRWLTEKFQRTLLPTLPLEIAGEWLSLKPFYQPAIQEMQMGGDFYDAIDMPNGMVGLVIGDVAGHGVEAAAQTALVTATLRAFATEDPLSPARVMARVNRALTLDHKFDVFVSVFYGVYDTETGMLRYANAGHEPPILIRDNGKCVGLESTGLVVGVEADVCFEESAVVLERGDCLVLITDGITEARNGGTGRMLGWPEAARIATRYREMVKRIPSRSIDGGQDTLGLAEALYREAVRFMGSGSSRARGLADDVALLTVVVLDHGKRREGLPASPTAADKNRPDAKPEHPTEGLRVGPEYRR